MVMIFDAIKEQTTDYKKLDIWLLQLKIVIAFTV